MDNDFTLAEEGWRESLQRLVKSLDSSAFQGDAPRERMKEELTNMLAQSKSVVSASTTVSKSMAALYEFIDQCESSNARRSGSMPKRLRM